MNWQLDEQTHWYLGAYWMLELWILIKILIWCEFSKTLVINFSFKYSQDYHRDRKYTSGAQKRKRQKEKEIESSLLKFLKTGNNRSEQISPEHDLHKIWRRDFQILYLIKISLLIKWKWTKKSSNSRFEHLRWNPRHFIFFTEWRLNYWFEQWEQHNITNII